MKTAIAGHKYVQDHLTHLHRRLGLFYLEKNESGQSLIDKM